MSLGTRRETRHRIPTRATIKRSNARSFGYRLSRWNNLSEQKQTQKIKYVNMKENTPNGKTKGIVL
jgi:hypothetical protein